MVSTSTAFISAALAVAGCASLVQGHGYMLVPESQFKDSKTSAWVVQIDPQWPSDDWDGNKQGSVDTYKALAAEKGVTEIRSLLDDTSIYGEDCGFTDPNGTPQPIPTDGKATFSRGIVHVGPCEIWLDDEMVLHDDDCYSTYGGEDQDVKSVFPVDYSVCQTKGCNEMRFYWLAFQGLNSKTVWQVYKDCIPLEGGSVSSSAASNSTFTETTEAPSTETETETETPSTDASASYATETETPATNDSEMYSTGGSETYSTEGSETYSSEGSAAETPETEAPETEAPEAEASATDDTAAEASGASDTPVASAKCNARDRKRA